MALTEGIDLNRKATSSVIPNTFMEESSLHLPIRFIIRQNISMARGSTYKSD